MAPILRDLPKHSMTAFVEHINQVRAAIGGPVSYRPVGPDLWATACEGIALQQHGAQIVAAEVGSLSSSALVFRRGTECKPSRYGSVRSV